MKFVALFFLMMTSTFLSIAQSADVDRGTEFLKNEQYQQAIDVYQGVLDEGLSSPELHYNMGLAYAKLKQEGYALWHFMLAQNQGMDSKDLGQNIQLVKESRRDEVEEINPFFLSRWWRGWRGLLGSNVWASLALVFVVMGTYGWVEWRTGAERSRRKMGFLVGTLAIGLSALFLASAVSQASAQTQPDRAILLSDTSALRAGADANSASILTVHAGLEVQIQDQIGIWAKVRMKNGQIGWIEMQNLGVY